MVLCFCLVLACFILGASSFFLSVYCLLRCLFVIVGFILVLRGL